MSSPADPEPADADRTLHEPDRSVYLADGVVAIAATLLALDLKPDLPHHASSGQLAHYLHTHSAQYVSFLLAYYLIARFWLIHHRVMRDVRALDAAAMWTNLTFLFAIVCLPLTTYINGAYSSSLATTLFAADILLISLSLSALEDRIRRRGLTAAVETPRRRVARRWQMITTLAVPLIVIAMAWVVRNAEYFFLLALLTDVPGRVATGRLHRRGDADVGAA